MKRLIFNSEVNETMRVLFCRFIVIVIFALSLIIVNIGFNLFIDNGDATEDISDISPTILNMAETSADLVRIGINVLMVFLLVPLIYFLVWKKIKD